MPRPISTSGYPTIYRKLLEKVIDTGKEFRYPCDSKKNAEYVRFTFYSFIKACRKSDAPIDQDLGELSSGVMFCIEGDTLILRKRDQSKIALGLAEAMKLFDEELAQNPSANYTPPPAFEIEDQDDVLSRLGYTGKKK